MYFQDVECGGNTDLAQYWDMWQALLNAVMILRFQ
jgi:hypothetical protein